MKQVKRVEKALYDDHQLFIETVKCRVCICFRCQNSSHVHLDEVIEKFDVMMLIVRVYAEVPRELIEYYPNEYIIKLDDDQNAESLSKEGITLISQATINYDMNMALVRTDKLLEMIDRAEENNYYKELDDVIIEYMDDYKQLVI